ncbi:MAG: acyltransferase family protein [Actinophytocola sp.]|uniref:acyltransferase family protein n=1 Tax=Actinophytocola sp. TaxID=1872138 RepID=UPI003D6C2376
MTAPEIPIVPRGQARDAKRAPRLDGLRGYLALGVIVVHVAFAAGIIGFYDVPGQGIWATLAQGLHVLLPPFFVMSGLLLYKPFAKATIGGTAQPAMRPYLLRRALRILPAYWLVALTSVLLLNFNAIDGIWYVLRPLLTVHVYWTYGQTIAGMEPTWTVPAEIAFYIALPLLAWLGKSFAKGATDPGQRARRLAVPLLLLVVVAMVWTIYTHRPEMGPFPDEYFWVFGFTAFLAIGMVLAIMMAHYEVTGREPALFRAARRHPLWFWAGALALYLVNCVRPLGKPGMSDYGDVPEALVEQLVFLPFAFLIIVPVIVPDVRSRFLDAVLANAPMRYFGRISYGVYLWHFVLQYLWLQSGSIFGEDPQPMPMLIGRAGFWELLAAVLIGTVIVASISYYAVELPAMRLRNKLAKSTRELDVPRQEPLVSVGSAPVRPGDRVG